MRKATEKTVKNSLHNCGNGFKGQIVKTRGISFCGFCGKEFGF